MSITSLCTSDPSTCWFNSRAKHRNRTAPYVVRCSQLLSLRCGPVSEVDHSLTSCSCWDGVKQIG